MEFNLLWLILYVPTLMENFPCLKEGKSFEEWLHSSI